MADEKFTIVDIRKAIARQMSLPSETAGKFLNALFPAIIDGLKRDKMVRISGLGCFKLVWVEPRKSVDVTTGESILLDGYNKLTFIPDSYIREQINEPFAGLEAVRVDENGQPIGPQSTLPGLDPRVRFGEQAQEIVGLLADLGQNVSQTSEDANEVDEEGEESMPGTSNEQTDVESENESEEEPLEYMVKELLPIVEDPKSTDISEEQTTENSEPKSLKTDEQEEEKKPVESAEGSDAKADVSTQEKQESTESTAESTTADDLGPFFNSQKKKKDSDTSGFKGWVVAAVTILVLLAMLIVGYFILVNKLEKWANSLGVEETDPLADQLQEISEDTIEMLAIEPLQPLDSTPSAPESAPEKKSQTSIKNTTETATISSQDMDLLAIETVSKGSRLTLIALKYYGKKDFWVYIYEANRDVIKNPSKLTTGTKLKIPRLTDDIMNMSDEELKVLHDKYIR